MAAPLVDRAVRLHPAQSLSLNPSISYGSSWNSNFDTNRGTSIRYRASLLILRLHPFVGLDIVVHISFTAYCISALANARKFARAANARYSEESLTSKDCSSSVSCQGFNSSPGLLKPFASDNHMAFTIYSP